MGRADGDHRLKPDREQVGWFRGLKLEGDFSVPSYEARVETIPSGLKLSFSATCITFIRR